jgi:hypothetical protein
MRPLIRLVVAWILIVLLPVQAGVAAIKLPCVVMQSSAGSQDISGESQDRESMDDCDESKTVAPEAPEHAAADSADQEMSCHDEMDGKRSSCLSCSACCTGDSAPPPLANAVPVTDHAVTDDISPISSFTGWIPSRVERPPRV